MYSLYYFIIILCTCIYILFAQLICWGCDSAIKTEDWDWGYLGFASGIFAPLEMLDAVQLSNHLPTPLTLLTTEILLENFNFTFIMLILTYTSNYPCVNKARFKLFTSDRQGQAEACCFLLPQGA